MGSLNKVQAIGRLVKSLEVKEVGGAQVCEFALAVNESFTNKEGVRIKRVEFIPCVLWGKRCVTLEKYVEKGALLYVEGKFVTTKYKVGEVVKYNTRVLVGEFQFLEGKANVTAVAVPTSPLDLVATEDSGTAPRRKTFKEVEDEFLGI